MATSDVGRASIAEPYPDLALTVVDIVLEARQAHVGVARRAAMDAALTGRAPEQVALLTTDADATPDPGGSTPISPPWQGARPLRRLRQASRIIVASRNPTDPAAASGVGARKG